LTGLAIVAGWFLARPGAELSAGAQTARCVQPAPVLEGCPVDLGAPVGALITGPGKTHTWTAQVPPGWGLHAELSDVPDDYDLYVISPAGTLVGESKKDGLQDEIVEVTPSEVGTYRIFVTADARIGADTLAPYRLTVSALCPWKHDDLTGIPTCDLGSPDQAFGIYTALTDSSQTRAIRFRVGPEAQSANIYVGSQTFDADLFVFMVRPKKEMIGFSNTSERMFLQNYRPDTIIHPLLAANSEYVVLIAHKYAIHPELVEDFQEYGWFVIRLELGPPACGIVPGNEVKLLTQVFPNSGFQPGSVSWVRSQSPYQLAFVHDPLRRGATSPILFQALLSPPFYDLFDFSWELNRQALPEESGPTMLRALPAGDHLVKITARGVRPYPSPDIPHQPAKLSVECLLRLPV
jgi:hypothetical protein